MKKLILLFIVFLLVTIGCTDVGDSDFTIKVSGTNGLEFNGNYMTLTSGGTSTGKSVEGTVPTQYTVRGNIVSVVFQKQSQIGTLKVEILRGGNVIAQSETSAAYGVVSVASD